MPQHRVAANRNPEVALDERDEPGSSGSGDDPPPESPITPESSSGAQDSAPLKYPTPPEFTIAVADDLSFAPDISWLEDRLARALGQLPGEQTVVQLDISVVGDEAMTTLHFRHQGIDETTDVLTFPMSESGQLVEVAIAVCVDEAQRQAEERGHSVEKELLLYIIHGVLHGLGFDDHDDNGFQRIHAEEDRIFEAIGVGQIFHGSDQGDDKE